MTISKIESTAPDVRLLANAQSGTPQDEDQRG